MNKPLSLLTAALLLTGASSVFAASSTDLTVKGSITPGACTPSLADSGVVDYGKIPAKDLNKTTFTRLEDKTIALTVTCDASKQFAISAIDNKAGTARGGAFGLGLINGAEKLGGYQFGFRNPVADVPVLPLVSLDKGITWSEHFDDEAIAVSQWIAFGNRTAGVWSPEPLQNVTVDVAIETLIAPADSLTLTSEVLLDGSATLQIEYP